VTVKLIEVLQTRVIDLFQGRLSDDRLFAKKVVKLEQVLCKLETNRYLENLVSKPL